MTKMYNTQLKAKNATNPTNAKNYHLATASLRPYRVVYTRLHHQARSGEPVKAVPFMGPLTILAVCTSRDRPAETIVNVMVVVTSTMM